MFIFCSSDKNVSAGTKEDLVDFLVPLLKKEEGLSLCPYKCTAGSLTIGYGHVINKGEEWMLKCITEQQALNILITDITTEHNLLTSLDPRYTALPTTMLAGLVHFQFNIGSTAYRNSEVNKILMSSLLDHPSYLLYDNTDIEAIVERDKFKKAFNKWNKITVDGKKVVLEALTERRDRELKLIMSQG